MKKRFLPLFFLFVLTSSWAEEKTTVESENADYDGHTLTLKGNVIVENPMGRLTAQMAFLRRDEEGESSIDFPWLHLSENVTVTFSSGGFLRCQKVDLDYNASTATLHGSPQQIYYRDEAGELFADWAQIDYRQEEGKVKPTKITLHGNVQMISTSSLKEKNKPVLQYALADNVEYFPLDERMIFRSDEGRCVLFYDKLKEMQLSAHTVHAARNAEGKESVQGIGDVRFVFKQDELEKLKQHFKWD